MTRKSRKRKFGSTRKAEECKQFFQPGDSCEEVKKNYHTYAKMYHPDRTSGDEDKEKKFKQLANCYEKAEKVCEDTKSKVLLLTDEKDPFLLPEEKDHLKDLEDNFPSSKESSISFPNIDKVNKKLSDLFDYIGKYTMEESEETEELEKQQIEAEIELAKAEAKQAIRESERKFGTSVKREISGWQLFKEERKELEQKIKENRDELDMIKQKNKEKVESDLKAYKEKLEKIKPVTEELQKIKAKLLGNVQVPDIYKKSYELYQGIVNKIIKEDYSIATDLPTSEAELFIKMFGMLVFFKEINIDKTEEDMFIKFILALDFIGGDVKDILLKNLLNLYYIDDTESQQTKLQAKILETKQKLEKDKSNKEKVEIKIDVSNHKLSKNNDGLQQITQIWVTMHDIEKKTENEIKSLENNLTNMIEKNSIENCKHKILSKYESLDVSENDDNIMLLSKILYGKKNPFKQIYDDTHSLFKAELTKIDQIDFIESSDSSEDMEPKLDIKKNVTNLVEPEIVSLKDLKEMCKLYTQHIDDCKSDLTLYLEKEKEYKDFAEKTLSNLKNNIKERNNRINRLINNLNKLNTSDLQKMDAILKAIENQKKFEEESKSIIIYLKSYGYDSVEQFLQGGQKAFNEAISERLKPFKTGNNTTNVTKEEKKFLENKVFTVKSPDTEDGKNTIIKNFIGLNTEIQSFIFSLIPVRTILNFATVVKPQGEKIPREIMEPNSFDGIVKADIGEKLVLKASGFYTKPEGKKEEKQIYSNEQVSEFIKYTNNALVNTAIAHKKNNDETIPLQEILGKEIQVIRVKDNKENSWKTIGPFYKIFHTSNKDESKKEYNIQSDIDRLIEGDLDHITYAGYGFSGSGKTYTLIESKTSILSKVLKILKILKSENKIKITDINVYEDYKERFDKDCNVACSNISRNFTLKQKLPGRKKKELILQPYINPDDGYSGTQPVYFKKNIDLKGDKELNLENLKENIKEINNDRAKTKIKDNVATTDHHLIPEFYRTSIRRTSFNDQSSRAHMFIDINFKVKSNDKKITVLDMAGSEKVQVIQDDYFKTEVGYKIDSTAFSEKIEAIIKQVKTVSNLDLMSIYSYFTPLLQNGSLYFKKNIPTSDEVKPIDISVMKLEKIMPKKPNYKIENNNIKNWEELNDDLIKQGSGIDNTEFTNFKTNYNTYQIYEKLEVIKNLHSIIKKSLENENKNIKEIDTTYFKYIHDEDNTKTFIRRTRQYRKDLDINNSDDYKKSSKIDMSRCLYSTALKERLNKFFKDFGLDEVENFYKLDKNLVILYNRLICNTTPPNNKEYTQETVPQCSKDEDNMWKRISDQNSKATKIFAEMYAKIYQDFNEMIDKLKEYLDDIKEKNIIKEYITYLGTEEGKKIIQQGIDQKKKWDKEIITKYHCPLRFQGNSINDSIEEFKNNLSRLNNRGKIDFKFPGSNIKWSTVGSTFEPKQEFVVFTNIRLDFKEEDTTPIANSFKDSLTFSHELLNPNRNKTRRRFGKKVSKKTSTRSFRKRGRRRGPSETEIL